MKDPICVRLAQMVVFKHIRRGSLIGSLGVCQAYTAFFAGFGAERGGGDFYSAIVGLGVRSIQLLEGVLLSLGLLNSAQGFQTWKSHGI